MTQQAMDILVRFKANVFGSFNKAVTHLARMGSLSGIRKLPYFTPNLERRCYSNHNVHEIINIRWYPALVLATQTLEGNVKALRWRWYRSLNSGRRYPVCSSWAPVTFRLQGPWDFFARLLPQEYHLKLSGRSCVNGLPACLNTHAIMDISWFRRLLIIEWDFLISPEILIFNDIALLLIGILA